jgi:hypothetical protein
LLFAFLFLFLLLFILLSKPPSIVSDTTAPFLCTVRSLASWSVRVPGVGWLNDPECDGNLTHAEGAADEGAADEGTAASDHAWDDAVDGDIVYGVGTDVDGDAASGGWGESRSGSKSSNMLSASSSVWRRQMNPPLRENSPATTRLAYRNITVICVVSNGYSTGIQRIFDGYKMDIWRIFNGY